MLFSQREWPLSEVVQCEALAIVDDDHSGNEQLFVIFHHDIGDHETCLLDIFRFKIEWIVAPRTHDDYLPAVLVIVRQWKERAENCK